MSVVFAQQIAKNLGRVLGTSSLEIIAANANYLHLQYNCLQCPLVGEFCVFTSLVDENPWFIIYKDSWEHNSSQTEEHKFLLPVINNVEKTLLLSYLNTADVCSNSKFTSNYITFTSTSPDILILDYPP